MLGDATVVVAVVVVDDEALSVVLVASTDQNRSYAIDVFSANLWHQPVSQPPSVQGRSERRE